MGLIELLILILVLCFVAWVFLSYVVPAFPAGIRPIIVAVAALILIIVVLSLFGVLPNVGSVRVGR